jgi:hypothetical protein
MSIEFLVPTKRIQDVLHNDIDKAISVRMEDLIKLDEDRWQAKEKILATSNYYKRNNGMIKGRYFEERKLVLWMPRVTKITGNKFKFPWEGPYKIHKIFNNNIVELTTMSNDEMGMENINKLKEYCHN